MEPSRFASWPTCRSRMDRHDIRGVILDVGRLRKGDPILDRLSFKIPFDEIYHGGWPKPGEELVMAAASVTRASGAIVEIAVPSPLPLEVDFSVPVEGEADVRLEARIRLQFSRDVDTTSLDNRIRMSYSASDSTDRGEAQAPGLTFTINYDPGTRVLEIRPAQALERFRPVKLDLLEGIVGTRRLGTASVVAAIHDGRKLISGRLADPPFAPP